MGVAVAKEWNIVEGRQWSVTNYGLLKPEDDYDIQAWQLGELCNDGLTPHWLAHVTRKGSTDLEDFLAMFIKAVRIHSGKFTPLPQGWRKAAADHIAKVRDARARHAAILARLAEGQDPMEVASYGVSYTLDAYDAAAAALYGDEWRINP